MRKVIFLRAFLFASLLFVSYCRPISVQSDKTTLKDDLTTPEDLSGWAAASSGEHSFRSLGDAFYVDLPVKKIKNARLVLFNHRAARQLGFNLPSDPKELERVILENFAVTLAKEGEKADRFMIATRYQDSGNKEPGSALGDGRAAWAGEVVLPEGPDRSLYIDFVLKGIGQTPLAWTNHNDPGHSDGLQSMNEAVHSFALSEANFRNGLDSTVDLAVIELPDVKADKHTGEKARAALTVRIGNQTRVAHLRYFNDQPEQFKKIFDYIIRRDMGRRLDARITHKLVGEYMDNLAKNLADEAARYLDLHAVHASPTPGNRTTKGSTIDMGTFRYLDANHGNYTYLFDQLALRNQTEQLKSYLAQVHFHMRKAHYSMALNDEQFAETQAKFAQAYEAKITELWLNRIGISVESQARIAKATKRKFYQVLTRIVTAEGSRVVDIGGRNVKPAAFDVRKILEATLGAVNASEAQFPERLAEAFRVDRSWGTLNANERQPYVEAYADVIQEIMTNLNPSKKELLDWMDHARLVNANKRFEPGRSFFEQYEKKVLSLLNSGKSYVEMSRQSEVSTEALVDYGVPRRTESNLGARVRIGIFSGTFNPPHEGHIGTIRNAIEALGLDTIYVVPNVFAEHKPDTLSYEHRRAMSELAFAGIPGVEIADRAMEKAFALDDMTGVINEVMKKHPDAEYYQIMGSDSFERYAVLPRRDLGNKVQVVVAGRGGIAVTRDGAPADIPPVMQIPEGRGSTSSTAIRKAVTDGTVPIALPPEVRNYIKTHGLYAGKDPGSGDDDQVAGGGEPSGSAASRCSALAAKVRTNSQIEPSRSRSR